MASLLDSFSVGQKIGKAKRSTFGMTSDDLMENHKVNRESYSKLGPAIALELFKSKITSPKEQAMTDYYKSGAELNRSAANGSSNSGSLQDLAKESGFSEEDYIQNPTVTRYKGQVNVQNTPQLKPPLDPKSTNEIGSFRSTRQNLQKNLGMIEQAGVKERMGPLSYSASRLPGANTFLRLQAGTGNSGASNFATFKAETDKVFQQFRKETTGAQAALKELGWLEPDYPSPSDPPEVYTQKANEAMKRLEDGEKLLLDLYSQRGFRVGELRRGNPLLQAAQPRADMAQDASANPRAALEARLRQKGYL